MIRQLKTLALALLSLNCWAEVDFTCKADCLNRYSANYCEQRCSYSSGNSNGSGYRQDGPLGALFQGMEQANRETQSKQQQELLQLQAILKELQLQERREQERREQASQPVVSSPPSTNNTTNGSRDFENGMLNYKGQKYDDALMQFVRAADAGHPIAQHMIGVMYFRGQGVNANPVEAYKWTKRSAEQGFKYAQVDLGLALANGVGVAKDPAEAVKWFRKAADQGLPVAQYNLAYSYGTGKGVEKDNLLAYRWLKTAAEGGHSVSQRTLGLSYLNGTVVVAKNQAEAVAWLKKSASQGDKQAQEALSKLQQ
jgi:hypothetical protein